MTNKQRTEWNVEKINHDLSSGTILVLILKGPQKQQKPVTTAGLWVKNSESLEHEVVKLTIYCHHKNMGCAGRGQIGCTSSWRQTETR
jgi:hypothetical protein